MRKMEKLVKIILTVILVLIAAACEKEAPVTEVPDIDGGDVSGAETVGHDLIVLGDKLEDPYSVKNVTKALEALYPTKAGRVDITPTDKYVRFLPDGDDQYQRLVSMGLELVDHPLDYKIVKDGDYYHDPALDTTEITWQYAVVPYTFKMPSWVRGEVLDECYIPDAAATRVGGIDWDAVEREAFRLTGNADLLEPRTKGRDSPEGRITIVDEDANGGKPFGVAGVTVVANVFVKFTKDHTDRDGYYKMKRSFSARPRYRLLFDNSASFDIGINKILIPASTSTLGKGSNAGIDYTVTKESGRKIFSRCVVNNAAYDYISKCGDDGIGVLAPPRKLRIWIFQKMDASSAVMLHHGAVLDNDLLTSFLGGYSQLIKVFAPDITIGVSGKDDYASIYAETCHELAHASHFAQVGRSYWDKYIAYVIQSFITTGGETYGNGGDSGAGYCEVGEIWAYFMQSWFYNQRYGGAWPQNGYSFWFHPQILRFLNQRGLSPGQIFKALDKDANSLGALKNKLLELYPEKSSVITQTFARYETV